MASRNVCSGVSTIRAAIILDKYDVDRHGEHQDLHAGGNDIAEHFLGEEGGAPKRPKPDHVPDLFDQRRIMRDFECLSHMRLNIIGGRQRLRGGFGQAGSFCYRAATPTPKMLGRSTGFLQSTAYFSGG
jgi:hypothetical protein